MAVNVDTVYQKVLAIANKEQRGYITPQEYNLLANQAQLEIFEQYFYDLNQFMRMPGNDTKYADQVSILQEKINIFEKFRQDLAGLTGAGIGTFPTHYKMGEIHYHNATLATSSNHSGLVEIEKIDQNKAHHILNSPLTQPTLERPIYIQLTPTTFQIYPTSITNTNLVACNYIAKPADVKWGYTMVNNEALYNATSSTNFELHQSEETKLVIKILELAGIIMKQQDIYSIANQEEIQDIQQQKA
tara:strand:+ start:1751 stop:2485 length:735 start_codon:yes stop_codon:yes gene_type:complete